MRQLFILGLCVFASNAVAQQVIDQRAFIASPEFLKPPGQPPAEVVNEIGPNPYEIGRYEYELSIPGGKAPCPLIIDIAFSGEPEFQASLLNAAQRGDAELNLGVLSLDQKGRLESVPVLISGRISSIEFDVKGGSGEREGKAQFEVFAYTIRYQSDARDNNGSGLNFDYRDGERCLPPGSF